MQPSGLDARLLDQDAVRAVVRLQSFGHEAYLVGGCVRDLLLGHRPKDFDIATSARPPAVKRSFPRNSRIIGRRFKLAHLHFEGNRKILEVSTFRRAPESSRNAELGDDEAQDEDLLITRDNEFGTAEEDAVRRDFTINALFLDPHRDELIDHVGGLDDIERGLLRTIGDPYVRFREDPVRILRAIKFAGRLGLTIEERTAAAMRDVAPDLVRAAPPRVLEEILRLLRGGHAFDAVQRLRDCGALRAILPTVDAFLEDARREDRLVFWRTLEALDGRAASAARSRSGAWPPENGVMLGCIFERVVHAAAALDRQRSPSTLAEDLIAPFAAAFRLPKRDAGCVKRICAIQHRFLDPEPEKRWRIDALLGDPYFGAALELFELSSIAEGRPLDLAQLWRSRARQRPSGRNHGFEDLEAGDEQRLDPASDEGEAPPSAAAELKGRDEDSGAEADARRRKRRRRGRDRDRERDPARGPQVKPAGDAQGRRNAAAGEGAAAAPERPRPERRDERREERREERRRRFAEKAERADQKRKEKIETIEPPPLDLSAFDVELDPRRVPTFGTIVEHDKKKPKPRRAPSASDDDYRPPPPPGSDLPGAPPSPPPAPSDSGSFGDW